MATYNNIKHIVIGNNTYSIGFPVTSVNSKTGAVSLTASDVGAATSGHTHTTSLTQTGTSTITLESAKNYTLTAGGTSVVFKMPTINAGTITGVTGNNGLTGSGTSGSVTIGHANTAITAQTTQAIYPIKIDAYGHITAYGTAVTPLTASSTLDATKLSGTIPSGCYTNTTYGISGSLSSHAFTTTLTAGGSGTTAALTLAAGTGISITDDTTNKKMTIACTISNTDTKMKFTSVTDGALYPVALGPSAITSGNAYEGCYSGFLNYTPNEGNLGVDFINSVSITSALTTNQNGIMLCDYQGTTDIILDPLDGTAGTLTIDVPGYNMVFDMGQVEQLLTVTDTSQGTSKFLRGDGSWAAPSIPSKNIWYATCPTGASTTAKIVTTDTGDFTLTTGNMLRVIFTNKNTASAPTLTVDSKTATSVRVVTGTSGAQYHWQDGEAVDFVYNGTYFIMVDRAPATTTYYGPTKLSDSTSTTSSVLAATPTAVKSAYDLANTANNLATNVNTNSYQVMTACVSAVVTGLTSTGKKMTLESSVNCSNHCSISSGGIKCAKSGYVLVSGQAQFYGVNDNNVCNLAIYQNSTAIALNASRSANDRTTIVVSPRLIQVAANDVFYIYVSNTSSSVGQAGATSSTVTDIDKQKNYLTVQYVKVVI